MKSTALNKNGLCLKNKFILINRLKSYLTG